MKLTSFGSRLAVFAAIFVFASPAYAGWGHFRGGSSGGGSYGSSGVYASSGSSGYSAAYASSGGSSGYSTSYASYGSSGLASGGSSGRVGLGQRLKAHMAAKRAHRAAYGSSGYASGGSSGIGYASSGGSSGVTYRSSYASSGGSSGSINYAAPVVRYSAPVSYGSSGTLSYGSSYGSVGSTLYHGASKTTSTSSVATLASNVDGDSVHLTVVVPSETKIFVNGKQTTSKGSVRQFVSHGLQPGKQYKFQVRAELVAADGKTMAEEKSITVEGGQKQDLQFAFDDYDQSIETALTLNVPEGAQVRLAGNQTKATGTERTYRTSHLKPGEVWEDYEVEVQLGDSVKRRSVRLLGGDNLQLSFNFDEEAPKLASLDK